MQQVKQGDKIKVHYHGKLNTGETFDSSDGREPLEFTVGDGEVIKGFEEGVLEMQVGDKKTIEIPVQDAYGEKHAEMIIELPKSEFPEDINPEPGMLLEMTDGSGQNLQVVITEIKENSVVLDANHPLAGEDLTFDLELIEIKPPVSTIILP